MKTPIDQSVDRFLYWKLPEAFDPDCGISFTRDHDHEHSVYGRGKYEPTGTNLFTAEQAKAMLEHVCEPILTALQERDAEIGQLKSIAYSDDGAGGEGMKLFLTVRAQRKVLEQALTALESIPTADSDCDEQTQREDDALQEAITAIQEQLK